MKPGWLEQLDEARAGKTRGYVLDGNTADRVHYPESGLPPIPVKYFLAAYLAREGYAVGQYSLANGFEEMRPPSRERNPVKSPFASLPNNLPPDQVLAHATRWLRNPDHKVALILDYADHMAPSSNGMNAMVGQVQLAMLEVMHAWGMDESIRITPNLVFLLSYESQVSDLLLRGGVGYKMLTIPLPNEVQRQDYIQALSARLGVLQENEGAEMSAKEMARVTSGLPHVEIEELLYRSATRKLPLDLETVRERKAAVINQLCHGLLDVHEPKFGFEGVSGLDHAKDELGRLVRTIKVDPQTATAALLLVGVPGCGKSFLVQALARELGYPCLAMRTIREGLVGASERNLERVLGVAETLSPCLIWQDEIDQMLGKRNTGQSMDAGTSERMMGRIWEFMGSMKHRGRILWVGTSNRPDVLDSALLDRFQLVIPFLHPTPSEVNALLPVLAAQVGRTISSEARCGVIAQLPTLQNPTVRSLQEVVARAGVLMDVDMGQSGSPIDHAHLEEAARDFKPNYNPMQHEFIALNALRMASFSSVLPWRSRKGLRTNAEIQHYLEGMVDMQSGELDYEKLNRRMSELAVALQVEQHSRRF
ncbi:MAG: ATP-binding protein [Acidobacteriota bacterium]|jgi:AAA+ superfamily predicted ATPase